MTDSSHSSEWQRSPAEPSPSRQPDFARIVLAYGVAVVVAIAVGALLPESLSPWWRAVWADVAATVVIFGFSRGYNNSSFYDAYWSVAPPLLLLYWQWATGNWELRSLLLMTVVWLWAVRLTHNWARGWHGLGHEDWRYVDLASKTGRLWPVVDLLGIHLFPTVWVLLGMWPAWLMLSAAPESGSAPLGMLDLLWPALGLAAVYLEFRADNVLRHHRLRGAAGVLSVDVWSVSRHPNYLGELCFWLSMALAGFAVSGLASAWLGIGAMLLLFLGVSIPMLEKRQLANKPDYAAYQATTPVLLPWRLSRWRAVGEK